jgi:asparagine synthase (glutamine-hydrolysing)
MTTLLSGYLLSAQGDRMLMGNSVEGRFPFLDPAVAHTGAALAPALKLRGLDEKHVLKRAFPELPESIRNRPKQPYRAPDARFLFNAHGTGGLEEVTSPDAIRRTGVFDPAQVARLLTKCRTAPEGTPLSNSDATALIAVLSTQVLDQVLRSHSCRREDLPLRLTRFIDRTRGKRRGALP